MREMIVNNGTTRNKHEEIDIHRTGETSHHLDHHLKVGTHGANSIRIEYMKWRSQILISMSCYSSPSRLTTLLLIQQEMKPNLQKFKLNFLTLTIPNAQNESGY